MARVAWKPLSPGMTMSIKITSGLEVFALRIASSPLSLATTSYPALVSMSLSTCLSVGESSTISTRLIAIWLQPSPAPPGVSSGPLQCAGTLT